MVEICDFQIDGAFTRGVRICKDDVRIKIIQVLAWGKVQLILIDHRALGRLTGHDAVIGQDDVAQPAFLNIDKAFTVK